MFAALSVLGGASALAQQLEETVPPQPGRLTNAPAPVVGILLMIALLLVVIIISLMPSKRHVNQ